jgi:hypothetical protein
MRSGIWSRSDSFGKAPESNVARLAEISRGSLGQGMRVAVAARKTFLCCVGTHELLVGPGCANVVRFNVDNFSKTM